MPEPVEDEVDDLLAAVARIPLRSLDPAEWTPPVELDEYRLIRPLGRGGMGSVWLAEDRLLERSVAVKFIAHSEPDKRTRARFALEARAVARLTHPNVVTVHRFGEIAGRPYLVSEYIRGESLDRLGKPVTWERALEIGVALARGLAAAHRHGIVHRDIKPANAILTAEGDAKLVDFGLAKLDHEDRVEPGILAGTGSLTHAGAIAGTPRYLAPEVRRGEAASRRSDVYQLGAILYELVTGRPVLDELLAAHEATALEGTPDATALEPSEVPSLVEHLRGGLDASRTRFAAIVARCLRRDPQERFAGGEELREALEHLLAPSPSTSALPEGNPYRGLAPFEAEHRAMFFGREAEIRAVIERLRAESFVLVTGDSGVGKSSLCRAGVLPRISDGGFGDDYKWIVASLTPGQQPLSTLASLLADQLELDEDSLATTMREQPSALRRELRRAGGADTGIVVFVDQLEELATLTERTEAKAFGAVLAELAVGGPGLRLLATVRSDFLSRVAELPGIGSEIARAIYFLRALSADGARAAIEGPATATGVRFESAALVDALVGSVAADSEFRSAVELPLLSFTLAQLWDVHDPATKTISNRSLEAIGGVKGALARHADGVLDNMLPAQRVAARKILLRLVTAERTRARRSNDELRPLDRGALDLLVRARLVVARGSEAPTYELAHERLIDGWPTLAGWISESTDALVVHTRLAAAVADWDRLERSREHLWSARQLAEVAIIDAEDLVAGEADFLRASRQAVRRSRWIRRSIMVAVPLAILSLYVGARLVARQDLDRLVSARLGEAAGFLVRARVDDAITIDLRRAAFTAFDAGRTAQAEDIWKLALAHGSEARTRYAEASRALEQAFLLDPSREDVREELAAVTNAQIAIAEREHRRADRRDLAIRLSLYDPELALQTSGPARLTATTKPPAEVRILDASGIEMAAGALAAGSYTVEARAKGRATVRQSVLLKSGEDRHVALDLPPESTIPPGFVYIPPGTFLVGSAEDESIRAFYLAMPLHEVETGAYLISTTEITYAQWFEFLDDLDEVERARRTPFVADESTYKAAGVRVRRLPDGKRELTITPATIKYTAREGEAITYPERTHRRVQDWRKFPVTGISVDDVQAYAAWLARTERVKRARMCTEHEWERAARGADGRMFPHGDHLAPDDANVDITYGQLPGGYGFDEVGSHPRSRSPFGLFDMAGNAFEMVREMPGTGFRLRGGNFYMQSQVANLANREFVTHDYRNIQLGSRICADAP